MNIAYRILYDYRSALYSLLSTETIVTYSILTYVVFLQISRFIFLARYVVIDVWTTIKTMCAMENPQLHMKHNYHIMTQAGLRIRYCSSGSEVRQLFVGIFYPLGIRKNTDQ